MASREEMVASISNRNGLSSKTLSEVILKAGKETCTGEVTARKGWFQMSMVKLLRAIERRNLAMARNMTKQTKAAKEHQRRPYSTNAREFKPVEYSLNEWNPKS